MTLPFARPRIAICANWSAGERSLMAAFHFPLEVYLSIRSYNEFAKPRKRRFLPLTQFRQDLMHDAVQPIRRLRLADARPARYTLRNLRLLHTAFNVPMRFLRSPAGGCSNGA